MVLADRSWLSSLNIEADTWQALWIDKSCSMTRLAIWIEEKHKLNRFDALMLCSQVGRIRIGNLWTVAA